jgi:hypothetical protein
MQRKQHSAEFKAKVAIEAIKNPILLLPLSAFQECYNYCGGIALCFRRLSHLQILRMFWVILGILR